MIVKCLYIIPAFRDGSLHQPAGTQRHFVIIIKANLVYGIKMMQNYKKSVKISQTGTFFMDHSDIQCLYKTMAQFSTDSYKLSSAVSHDKLSL